jgi:putative DNA primase/helicase
MNLQAVDSKSQKEGKPLSELSSRTAQAPLENIQLAAKVLYPEIQKWICFDNVLYKWEENYYQKHLDEEEIPRIHIFCNNFSALNSRGNIKRPLATPAKVKDILEWIKQGYMVAGERINPPGLNCVNGVLELHWEDKTLVHDLVPHDPTRHIYLSRPTVKYNPTTDPTEYDRLMECLDPESRDIWEKTIAASLDLETVRKHQGRGVRALLCKGDGSNGKDTLRVMVEASLGSIASCSMRDWQQYDSGHKFGIAPLRGKRISWPSENANVGKIDQLQGLKAAITGDPISFERKHCNSVDEPPQCVFLFNLNDAPNLIGGMDAIKTRWAIIPFSKTYSGNPQAGQLQADPRFKEDPDFINHQILPAFLNRLLKQLQALVLDGIDYSHTQSYLDKARRESCHLLQFAYDVGLEYNLEGSVTVKELWERLQSWYIDNGTLDIEDVGNDCLQIPKRVWHSQATPDDKSVTGQNQVVKRFLEIFPKAKKGTERPKGSNNAITKIEGISFSSETAAAGIVPHQEEISSHKHPLDRSQNPC